MNNKTDCKGTDINPSAKMSRRSFVTGLAGVAIMLGMSKSGLAGSTQHMPKVDTETKIKQALSKLKSGYHCSQCVFNAFASDFNIDPKTALKMSCALAGGSIVGGECGAVGSGYLVIGLRYGVQAPSLKSGEADRQLVQLFSKIGQYVAWFENKHQAITCLELTGVNVFDPVERQTGAEHGAFDNCGRIVANAIKKLDSLL
jgi:C_GCAxxG_C_C family probable redox protein